MHQIPINAAVVIQLDAPFHVGGGKGGGSTCSYLARSSDGAPYWPGSAFKGKVRHYARLLYDGREGEACSYVHRASFDDEDISEQCNCPVCDMLGSAGNAKGSLLFSDMKLPESVTETRTGNSIDRYRRTAKDTSLFQIECASGDRLEGSITGTLSSDHFEAQCELLQAAIEMIPHIGGNTGRGLGWVKHITVTIDKADTSPLQSPAKDWPEITVPVVLTAQSPLLIGTKSNESNFRTTLHHIPGGVVRAALAQAIIAQDGGADAADGKVNWVAETGGLGQFPALRKAFGQLRITQFLPAGCRTAPMTAMCPKYDSKQSFDTLLEDPPDDVSAESVKQFMNSAGVLQSPPSTMVITKSAMNRLRGTSQDEMLFSLEVMTPPIQFEGTISGKFNPAELERLTEQGIRVGGYQTAGYGCCSVELQEKNVAADTIEALRERIAAYTNKTGEKNVQIPITLLSDAVVQLKEPAAQSNDDYLQAYQQALFAGLPDIKLKKAIAKHSQWRGFDTSKSKGFLNKIAHIIQAGAVFVLSTDALTEELLAALLALQAKGICQEDMHNRNGYGQIRIADEYHMIGRN